MHETDTTSCFAGCDGRTASELPTWFASEHNTTDVTTFAAAIRTLPRATQTEIAYRNPYTDEWVETERFNAVVEPERLANDGNDIEAPLFHVPTSNYAIINPTEVYQPLADVLRTETVDGMPLAEVCFGELRQYRGGGEVHMDIMFDGLEVTLPGRGEPITMGVTTGYDFFGETAVYVEGFARDTACANSIRALTDRQVIKHVGDVGDFEVWWREMLGQLELVANDLHGFIQDAREADIGFTEVPFDLTGFYELLGFPTYLAEHAAEDARANAPDPFVIDLWTLHSGATYALTHFFRGKEGSALQRYTRLANDLLFNPEASIERVTQAYERQLDADRDGDSDQRSLDEATGLVQVEQVSTEIRDLADQFEEREQQLRARFETATE
jgi:hypothetical protein